jgi:hypothetical protein
MTDETVLATHRGAYLAFTDGNSDGLRRLARAGMNSLTFSRSTTSPPSRSAGRSSRSRRAILALRKPTQWSSSLDRGAEIGLDQTVMTTTGPGWVATWRASDGPIGG